MKKLFFLFVAVSLLYVMAAAPTQQIKAVAVIAVVALLIKLMIDSLQTKKHE